MGFEPGHVPPGVGDVVESDLARGRGINGTPDELARGRRRGPLRFLWTSSASATLQSPPCEQKGKLVIRLMKWSIC